MVEPDTVVRWHRSAWRAWDLLRRLGDRLPLAEQPLHLPQLAAKRWLIVDRRRHDRRLWSLLARGWSGWRGTLVMVEPDTVVRWHRSAWRAWDGKT